MEKPESDFYKKAGTSILRSHCKLCHTAEGTAWRRKNKESSRRYVKEWLSRNPRYSSYAGAKRRAREYGVQNDLTLAQWEQIFGEYEGRCAYCLNEPATDIEHIHPMLSGGPNTANNVVPACELCNNRKTHKVLVPHLASKFWPPPEMLLA